MEISLNGILNLFFFFQLDFLYQQIIKIRILSQNINF